MKRFISVVAYILVVIGALNWGLWGFFQFDVVAWLFNGNTTWLSRLVYSIIGLAAVWSLGSCGRCCKALCCKTGESSKCCKHGDDSNSDKSGSNKSGTCSCCGGTDCNCNCKK